MGNMVNVNKMVNGLMAELWSKKAIDHTVVGSCHVFTAGAQAAARKFGGEITDCSAALMFYDYVSSLRYSKGDINEFVDRDTLLAPTGGEDPFSDAWCKSLEEEFTDKEED